MSKKCCLTNKSILMGNNRSHAMNATRRKFLPNLQKHKFWIESQNKFISLKVSTKAIRIIDKYGIEKFLNIK